MAIIPVNLARVSQNLRSYNLLRTVQSSQAKLFSTQNQLATGLKFQAPSEAPSAAAATQAVDRQLDRVSQVKNNLTTANATLSAAESAMDEAIELMREAKRVTIEGTSDTVSDTERASLAIVVTALIDQAISIGNRQHLGTYLFSGDRGGEAPFEWALSGVQFNGDEGRRETIIATDLSQDSFTISGQEFFGAVSTPVVGAADLSPAVTADTRIRDLRGPAGEPPELGSVSFSDGAAQVTIDLSGADTVGDIVDKLNQELPAALSAEIVGNRLHVTGGVALAVQDVGGGNTTRSLGITTPLGGATEVFSSDLDPMLTLRTTITQLYDGAGADLAGGIRIRNGELSAEIDLARAETVEDIVNLINSAGVGAWARISDDGDHIDIHNRVSGTDLTVEEAGGSAATNLGIRTISDEVTLDALNLGKGVNTITGDDIHITTSDGTVLDFDVDQALTLEQLFDLLNADGAISAAFATDGNGIVITDNTAGGGTLSAEAINLSPALGGLGLDVVADANGQLVGTEINPIRVESTFTTLLEIREGMEQNDTRMLTFAGERLERTLDHMERVRGQMAAQAKVMDERLERIESEETFAQVLRSDIRDVDITEAVVRFQQVENALQANLTTASRVMNLSLIDYLR